MTIEITIENFTAAMREAVAERGPDFVYPKGDPAWEATHGGCRYQLEDGTPACLIGLALHKIDPDLVPDGNSNLNAGVLLRRLEAPASVQLAAQNAQEMQDTGKAWGRALAMYENLVRSAA